MIERLPSIQFAVAEPESIFHDVGGFEVLLLAVGGVLTLVLISLFVIFILRAERQGSDRRPPGKRET